MTNRKNLIEVFLKLDLGFTKEQIEAFIDSIPRAIKLLYAIEEADRNNQTIVRDILMAKLMVLNDSDQWPVLCKIGDRKLALYHGFDEGTVTEFVFSITDEMKLRLPSNPASIQEKREAMRIGIKERMDLFRKKFDFNKKEIEKLKEEGIKLYEETLNERKSPPYKVLKTLVILGTVAGGAYGAYKIFKPKNKSKN